MDSEATGRAFGSLMPTTGCASSRRRPGAAFISKFVSWRLFAGRAPPSATSRGSAHLGMKIFGLYVLCCSSSLHDGLHAAGNLASSRRLEQLACALCAAPAGLVNHDSNLGRVRCATPTRAWRFATQISQCHPAPTIHRVAAKTA